ncbi:MAG: GNAT family N-acetyltransferase [Candidatus Delongbacteria bacterium]|nr:GNAT family N-acetyltransferase [Candidatus Delongbacteria bacterium]
MFSEISMMKLAKYCSSFPGHQLKMVLASLVEDNTSGQLWVAPQSPGKCLLLLWDQGNNVLYIGGEPVTAEVTEELSKLLQGEVRERALAAQLTWFKVALLPSWEGKLLQNLFPDVELRVVNKLFYSFTGMAPNRVETADIPGIEFALIDKPFLARDDLKNLDRIIEEINWMWSDAGRRRAAEFGIAALVENQAICWCTAEYVSQKMCGSGIETLPEYEGRGVATATAARFVERCLERALIPYWECDRENIGSVRVAEKVGFTRLEERPYWVGHFS